MFRSVRDDNKSYKSILIGAATLKDSHLPEIIHRRGIDPKLLKLAGGR